VVRSGLPAEISLADLIADSSWSDSLPAIDGLWEAWSRLEAFARLVADPSRAEWRSAITSFAQVLTRQADRDPAVTLFGFFDMADEEGFEADPLIPHRPEAEQVALTTLHQSKGLEFDAVFIANAVEGVFPDLRRSRRMLRPELLSPERLSDGAAQHLFQVQEEMRLAYTAMTRAHSRVVWTATSAGADQGEHRPSRFLVAASGAASIADIGPPAEVERPPVTVMEAEVAMRRAVLDPAAPSPQRLAAARVLAAPPEEWWEPMAFAGVPDPGPNQPLIGPGLTLSPSQADSYVTCPRKYALERRLRLGDPGSPYAQFGTLVHSALERAEMGVIGTGQAHAELEAVFAEIDAVWAEEADFGTPELDAAWLRHAREAVTRLYEKWPSPDGLPIDLEMKVGATIDGTPWAGVIDRLERTPEGLKVVDYKTTKNPPTTAQAASSIQLGFYATAVAGSLGEPVCAAEMWFPRVDSKRSVTTRSLNMSSLVDLEQEMARVTAAIKEEMWEPRVGDGCKHCGFRLSCPAWPEGKGAYLP
jgi:ATP-dependent exoDNAse (exonuclease V) beta subunit